MNSKMAAYIGIFMGMVITGLGLVVALKPDITDIPMVRNNAVIVGGLFALYGLFRLYRSYMQLRALNEKL
jgi:hypothetical protein